MQNNWKLSKDILNILGTIYNRFEFDGMLLERISDKDIKDLQNVDGLEDILIDTENGKRVHPILETSFLTVTDSTHRISILFSGDGTSKSHGFHLSIWQLVLLAAFSELILQKVYWLLRKRKMESFCREFLQKVWIIQILIIWSGQISVRIQEMTHFPRKQFPEKRQKTI